jgi:hypothetical protein
MGTRFVLPLAGFVILVSAQAQAQAQAPATGSQTPVAQPGAVPNSLTAPGSGVAAPHTSPCVPCPADEGGQRLWGGAEYLVWWVQGQRVPALVTTSPPGTALGQAGVLGVPGTGVLFGDSRINDRARHGVRLTLGTWLDDCRTCGVGGEFFILGDSTDGFAAASPGSPIIMRPFFNTVLNRPDAEIVAFPGIASGGIDVSTSSQLLGAGLFTRHLLCEGCLGCGNAYSFEGMLGYRYLNLYDEVSVTEQVNSIGTTPGAPPLGTSFRVNDTYRTLTQFHGPDVGVAARLVRDRLCLTAMARLAFGWNVRDLKVDGSTALTVPGLPATTSPGGLLSAGRIGETSSTVFSLVPEFRLGLGYRITERACVTVGYNLMWWTNVARAGDQIDLRVDTNLLPPALIPVVNRPPAIRDTTIWIQGFTAGLTFDY